MSDALTGFYFTRGKGEWLIPTDHCRGPWDVNACHAGPPTAMIARAMEFALKNANSNQRLCRLTVNLTRPVPMSEFRVDALIVRAGRSVTTLTASLLDTDNKERITASGLAMIERPGTLTRPGNITNTTPRFTDAQPGDFPITRANHDKAGFAGSIQTRYPPGQDANPGPTTAWLKSVPLLQGETASGFQQICPLADSGNAFSRLAQPWEVAFVNSDLTINLHREPQGQWLGSQSNSHWQRDGIGLADALLFDETGPVGRATQTLLLTPFSPVGS